VQTHWKVNRRRKVCSGSRPPREPVGEEIYVSELGVGDLLHRLDKEEWWIILVNDTPARPHPIARRLVRMNVKTLQVEEWDIVSLVAKYWEHVKLC
jgi:hypothetical protein